MYVSEILIVYRRRMAVAWPHVSGVCVWEFYVCASMSSIFSGYNYHATSRNSGDPSKVGLIELVLLGFG